MRRLGSERGQALVEVVAAVPVLLLVGLVLLQALAVGYAAVLAGHRRPRRGARARSGR